MNPIPRESGFDDVSECPSVNKGHDTCLCFPRCQVCGYGPHGVAHSLPEGHKLGHKFTPNTKDEDQS